MGGGTGYRGRILGLLRQGWRNWWRAGAATMVALAGFALLTLGPAAAVAGWQEYAEHRAQVRAAFQVGDPVQDGPVTFVLHEVRCGATEESTHGQRCEVLLGARNDGDAEVSIPGRLQSLHVARGARHLPVTGRASQPLAPQEAATLLIRFDLPLEGTITHLELRAEPYSRGVPVAVGDPYPLIPPE